MYAAGLQGFNTQSPAVEVRNAAAQVAVLALLEELYKVSLPSFLPRGLIQDLPIVMLAICESLARVEHEVYFNCPLLDQD